VATPAATNAVPLSLTCGKSLETDASSDATGIGPLTRGLTAGDEGAFREFHDRYFERLHRFLLVVARGNEDEAREALQQTLLRVVRYARPFESEGIFWSWLKLLARSAARDAGRKQKRYFRFLDKFALWFPAAEANPPSAEEDQLRGALAEALTELAPEERGLLEAKYLEGLTVKEIADESRLTHKAVESRLSRLRAEVRERILRKLNKP